VAQSRSLKAFHTWQLAGLVSVIDMWAGVQVWFTDLNRRPQFCRIERISWRRSHWETSLNWGLFAGTR